MEVSQLSHLWYMTWNPRVAPALWGLMVETRRDAIYICRDFSFWKPGDHMSHLPFKLWFFKERSHLASPPSPEKLVETQALGPSQGPPNHKVRVRALEMVLMLLMLENPWGGWEEERFSSNPNKTKSSTGNIRYELYPQREAFPVSLPWAAWAQTH